MSDEQNWCRVCSGYLRDNSVYTTNPRVCDRVGAVHDAARLVDAVAQAAKQQLINHEFRFSWLYNPYDSYFTLLTFMSIVNTETGEPDELQSTRVWHYESITKEIVEESYAQNVLTSLVHEALEGLSFGDKVYDNPHEYAGVHRIIYKEGMDLEWQEALDDRAAHPR